MSSDAMQYKTEQYNRKHYSTLQYITEGRVIDGYSLIMR